MAKCDATATSNIISAIEATWEVAIEVRTGDGVAIYYVTAHEAERLADQLKIAATAARALRPAEEGEVRA